MSFATACARTSGSARNSFVVIVVAGGEVVLGPLNDHPAQTGPTRSCIAGTRALREEISSAMTPAESSVCSSATRAQ